MKTIGLVVGHHCDTALEIKAAILAKDASVTVLLDEGDFVEPAADATDALKEATRKINNFNAVKRLQKAGADVIGFAAVVRIVSLRNCRRNLRCVWWILLAIRVSVCLPPIMRRRCSRLMSRLCPSPLKWA